jgi:hypothetical protein
VAVFSLEKWRSKNVILFSLKNMPSPYQQNSNQPTAVPNSCPLPATLSATTPPPMYQIKLDGVEHQKDESEIKSMLSTGHLSTSDLIYDVKHGRWTKVRFHPDLTDACKDVPAQKPSASKKKSLSAMQIVGVLVGLFGVTTLGNASSAKTTVCDSDEIRCVHNIGLISEKQNSTTTGGVAALAGVILYVSGRKKPE